MVNFKNKKVSAKEIFNSFSEDVLELDSKEGLALLNGTQFMSAHATYAFLKLESLFNWTHKIVALSLDAYNCRLSPFDPKPHSVRPHKGQIECAKKILDYLSDSDLVKVNEKDVQDPILLDVFTSTWSKFRCFKRV